MRKAKTVAGAGQAKCLCGAVEIAVTLPAFWAWHDHSRASQRAHGAACATYVGCWKSKVRVAKGVKSIADYVEPKTGAVRSFCVRCGTPVFYARARSPRMINIPRALFETRTGREPLYHIALEDAPEWEYRGAALAPLKAYPGVMMERSRKKKPAPAPF